MRKNNMP